MADRVDEARVRCGNYFREGYNCAESVFLGFQELVLRDIDRSMVKSLTSFGGGIGESGCVCGALVGATMVLSCITGRTTNDNALRLKAYDHAAKLYERFESTFGSTCCRALSPYPYETRERLRNCLKITGTTGKLLMEYLVAEGLVPAEEV